MNEYLKAQGYLSIGSRLRAISDTLFKQGNNIYKKYCPDMNGRWFPILRLLSESDEPLTIMAIAEQTGFTHPYVIAQSKKMIANQFVKDERDQSDERRRLLSLTEQGRCLIEQVKPLWECFETIAKNTVDNAGGNFLDALDRFEQELALRPWDQAADQYMLARENTEVEIIDYDPKYADEFVRINVNWVEKYFKMEDVDRQILFKHKEYILDKGGYILFAKLGDRIIGACALKKEPGGVYELTKMGVDADVQGKGVGKKLMQAVIEKFKTLNGKQLYLETNSILHTAIRLYKRHNFIDQGGPKPDTVYDRADVYMIWQE